MKQRPFIGPVELKVVNFGIDTFLVNFKFAGSDGKPNGGTLPEHVVFQLDAWQQEARKKHEPIATPLEYHGQTLFIRPHGKETWSWLLFNEEVAVSFSHGSMSGSVFCQVRFSSHLLWSFGAERSLVAMQAKIYDFTKPERKEGEDEPHHMIHAQASEIHICADMQGWYAFTDGSIDWQRGFVSRVVAMRARPDEPTQEEQEGGMTPTQRRKLEESIKVQPVVTTTHRRIATLDFGSHGSEIMGQIYNKSAEIIKSKKSFFEEIWRANGWDGQSTIVRTEIRVKRKGLASFDLNDAYDVLSRISQLWDYATQEWLRYVDLAASTDSNKSRLPSDCVWEAVQAAYPHDEEVGHLQEKGEQEARMKSLLENEPLQVLGQAFTLSHDLEQTVTDNIRAIEHTLQDEPIAVKRSLAQEEVDKLTPEQQKRIVNHLSPIPFYEVQTTLIKRARRMAKKKAAVAALAGYLTSLMALSVDEVAEEPDLMASLKVAFTEIAQYNKSRGRSHLEHVWKKRLKYGFVTAQQVEEEARLHGVDLSDEDWSKVYAEMEVLMHKVKNNTDYYRYVA